MLQPIDQLPILSTTETASLRSEYPSIEHLEAGNVAAWLMERQDQLLVRAKDERVGMNIAKLVTLSGSAVGALFYATSPLAIVGAGVAAVGYVWTLATDINDSHSFAPLPFVRGNLFEFIEAMGDKDLRDQWFASRNEVVELMQHLPPLEKYEFGMLKIHSNVMTGLLTNIMPGRRFYAYRWLLDQYINLKGEFPSAGELQMHLANVTPDLRINQEQVGAIASALSNSHKIATETEQKAIASAATVSETSASNNLDGWLSESPTSAPVIDVVSTEVTEIQVTEETLLDKLIKTSLDCLATRKSPCTFSRSADGYKFWRLVLDKPLTTNVDNVFGSDKDLFSALGSFLPELSKAPMITQIRGGKVAIDIAKPEKDWQTAYFKDYIVPARHGFEAPVQVLIGMNLDGRLIEITLSKHETCGLLAGGITGGGKSRWAVAAVAGILCQYQPSAVKLILSDTKKVEFRAFECVPHLFAPVAYTVVETIAALSKAEKAMLERENLFANAGVSNLEEYNAQATIADSLPSIVIFIEETADAVESEETYTGKDSDGNRVEKPASKEFVRLKDRIKRKARFAGIYLIDSTQSPRREILDPKYRGQFSAFLAFRTGRPEESEIILANQYSDAVKLLGRGDALYLDHLGLERVQTLYISPEEVVKVVERVKNEHGCYVEDAPRTIAQVPDDTVARSHSGSSKPVPRVVSDSSSSSVPVPKVSSSSSSVPSSTPSSSSVPSSTPSSDQNSIYQDYLTIRELRSKGVRKGQIIKGSTEEGCWGIPGSKYKEIGNPRYIRAIEQHGAEWIRSLRSTRTRISAIVDLVYSIPRGAKDYQSWKAKVMQVLSPQEIDEEETEDIDQNPKI